MPKPNSKHSSSAAAAILGKIKSPKKAQASKRNGAEGGRGRKSK